MQWLLEERASIKGECVFKMGYIITCLYVLRYEQISREGKIDDVGKETYNQNNKPLRRQ